ncbi:hypothetical protein P167DRAFT_412692 [Morchella conica CCBAS932]|uniref:Uncharacterized protein n=1 Tax=Morchella conica CCBAS932 TaxID=1392247 RepID=A0A3N4KYT9_9PEZI|nr:hypothetical protein P167DRAFT_412692 [Morchella conica CCBAS932]
MNVCLSEYGAGFANRDRQSHRMFLFGEAGVEGWVGKLRIPPLRGSVKVHCILHFVLRLAGCCEKNDSPYTTLQGSTSKAGRLLLHSYVAPNRFSPPRPPRPPRQYPGPLKEGEPSLNITTSFSPLSH